MKTIIEMFFWVLHWWWILLLSAVELFIFMALFVEVENIELFLDTFWNAFVWTLIFINFLIYWWLWVTAEKLHINIY